MNADYRADLVLVGGGHAHVQVLRRWMMAPIPDVRVTLIVDRPEAVYSGMVPGFVAGDYAESELVIDVVALARRARARVVLTAAVSVDPAARRVEVEGRPPIAYDVASLDVGSTVRGLQRPGVREHALATRPIGLFVAALDERLESLDGDARHISIVGAGAAGLELACTLEARLRTSGRPGRISVFTSAEDVLDGYPRRARRLARDAAESRGIRIRTGAEVVRVHADALELSDARIEAALVIWATGAAALPFPTGPGLPLDAEGFLRVRPTLQVEGWDDLFAVGDCASLGHAPWVRKAGVYAVRGGPVLDANLRARLRGRPLSSYRPQRDFLTLLNLGDREALGAKWGLATAGPQVWQLKDWIDRRFMRRFRVLDGDGSESADFPTSEAMGMQEKPCGGCAAKVGASTLEAALARLPKPAADASVLVGLAEPDDAAIVALPRGDVLLATVDAFRGFTDDPWLVGRVAAVNAASDVFAVGGTARHALALVNVPESDPARAEETLFQVLSGVRAAFDPLGISLVGGHTTQGGELYVGITVTGELGDEALRSDGLAPDQALVLSKPLGSGVVLAADMQGRLRGTQLQTAIRWLVRANDVAARVAREHAASACTDVSGFGLAGHLGELLRASGVSARIFPEALPALPGALELIRRGLRSSYHEQNERGRREIAVAPEVAGDPAVDLLFDPQTSGGLLFGVEAERADSAIRSLRAGGDEWASLIGVVTPPRSDGALFEVAPRERRSDSS